jgi:hypothetical protein
MWYFMHACYLFSLLTGLLLGAGFFQSFLKFPLFAGGHVAFMLPVSVVYFFTETLIIFFFVGTGVSVREYTRDHDLPPVFHQSSIAVKRKVYPPLMLNMLGMIILLVISGAVDTRRAPGWLYTLFFGFYVADYVRVKINTNRCFRENTEIILKMSGVF